VARQIIQEQMRDGGNALPWGDRERYCRLMLERSIASYREHAASDSLTFFDRGIGDSLCYARLIGLALEDEIFDVSQRYRYAKTSLSRAALAGDLYDGCGAKTDLRRGNEDLPLHGRNVWRLRV
jgi:predicted ATPase